MKMDVVTQQSDKLEIANIAAGSYTITAQDNDATLATSGRERFNLVEIGGTNSANFTLTHGMELGAWMYSTRQTAFGASGSAVQVYSTGLSNAASATATVNTFASGYIMGYAETNTLVQRLGESCTRRPWHLQAEGRLLRRRGAQIPVDGLRV